MNSEKKFICEFCNRELATKQTLTKHEERCKEKKVILFEREKKENDKKIEHEHLNQVEKLTKQLETVSENREKQIETLSANYEKQLKELIESNNKYKQQTYILEQQNLMYKDELRIQKEEFDKRILKLEYEYKIDIKCKEEQLKAKEEQLKAKDDYIKKLEEECNDYKKISKEALTKPTTVIDNSKTNNTTYNNQYNQMVGEIKPFTQTEVSKMVSSIPYSQLIGFNKKVDDNFVSQFVNAIKDLTFCTDSSRGNLVVKDAKGNITKMLSEAFVTECFKKGKKEIYQLIKDAVKFVNDAYESERYDYDEYSLCMTKLSEIKVLISKEGVTPIVKSVSTSLVKSVKQLANNKGVTVS